MFIRKHGQVHVEICRKQRRHNEDKRLDLLFSPQHIGFEITKKQHILQPTNLFHDINRNILSKDEWQRTLVRNDGAILMAQT